MNNLTVEKNDLALFLFTLVTTSSKSRDAKGNNDVQEQIAKFLSGIGMRIKNVENKVYGNCLIAETTAATQSDVSPITFFGHTDTVFSVEQWVAQGKDLAQFSDFLRGPGCYDMKAGIVQLCTALHLVKTQRDLSKLPIKVVLTPDEEIASPSSRELLLEESRNAAAAIIFEFGRTHDKKNAIVTSRKGRGQYKITCKGVEGHAGNYPDLSKNAIAGMGMMFGEILQLGAQLKEKGGSLNPGIISGGSANNVRAGECELTFEIRVNETADLESAYTKLKEMCEKSSFKMLIEETSFAHALEETPESVELFELFQEACVEQDLEVIKSPRSGGLSQANHLYSGIPILDAVGPIGQGAHTFDEAVSLNDLQAKTLATARFLLKYFK